jgi:hypothetical protein
VDEKKLDLEFKLKLLHSNKSAQENNVQKSLQSIVERNSYSRSTLKFLFLVQHKDKSDHAQTKRAVINSLIVDNSNYTKEEFENHKLENLAYKNTYYINTLYQLYKFKYYLDENKII